jgi:hypothetical protein
MKAEQTQPSDSAKQEPYLSRRDAIKGFTKVAGAVAVGGASTSQVAEQQQVDPCEPKNPYGSKPGSGISMPPYYRPGMRSGAARHSYLVWSQISLPLHSKL